ncbi:5351_t:CDS:2 [Diversispora eburnea]|uniref:5351_t:CDS:1 n=1 Tax=Diversispora eburnea TaxID=1213867 RepID=A0A9N8V274_9GLOM|nr:5351_t:CDS:2 [Diversispora eburnea]
MSSTRFFSRISVTNPNIMFFKTRLNLQVIPARNMSAFAKFMETIKEQLEKNKELQQNVKLLQDHAGHLGESETLRKAKQVYAKAKEGAESTTTFGSEKLKEIKKSAEKISVSVSETLKEVGETPFVKGTQEKISIVTDKVSSATEPIRQTKAYENIRDTIKETVGDDASRYGGFVDKETRRKMKEEAISNSERNSVKINPKAGSSVVLHKDSAWKESWNKFKETNPIMQGMFNLKKSYQDSDSIIISFTRGFTDRISEALGSFFEENETAFAIRQLKLKDPKFNLEDFMEEARKFIVPEIMEAYLKGDAETLKIWCSEAKCRAKVLDNDVPVLVLSFHAQEVVVFRDKITKEIIYGREDQIDQATYACVITKQEDMLTDPLTNGWRVIDMAKHGSQTLLW